FCSGYYYPYPYQNVNWYNFPFVWSSVATGGQFDSRVPLAGVGVVVVVVVQAADSVGLVVVAVVAQAVDSVGLVVVAVVAQAID
ncbi:unnamed protein product, partial [Rotaria sp. Silwood2]